MTVFALLAQDKVRTLQELIRGGTFAESWVYYKKYHSFQSALGVVSLLLAIAGTVIWGYGDLLLSTHF